MYKDGMTVTFDANEDINYRDIYMSNKGGYTVEFDLDIHDNVFTITVSRDECSYTTRYSDWVKLDWSLDDDDIMERANQLWYEHNMQKNTSMQELFDSSAAVISYGDIRLENPYHHIVSFSGAADRLCIYVDSLDDKPGHNIGTRYSSWLASGYDLASPSLFDDIKKEFENGLVVSEHIRYRD